MPRKSGMGHGRPIPDGLRSGAGAREVWLRSRQARMSGRAFSLVTFSLRGQRESDSAGGRNPGPVGTSITGQRQEAEGFAAQAA